MNQTQTAAQRWREGLESLAIPQRLIDAAGESPYGWKVKDWKKRRTEPENLSGNQTIKLLQEHLEPGDTIIDAGAGTGRLAVPLAQMGYRLIGVEKDDGMAQGLRDEAERFGVDIQVIQGAWQDVVDQTEPADAVFSSHVCFDVPDIAPFVQAMDDRATKIAAIELPPQHPWTHHNHLMKELHDWDRPIGPTIEVLIEVVTDVRGGKEPNHLQWEQPTLAWFNNKDDMIDAFGKRLVARGDQREKLAELLEPGITEENGRFYYGNPFGKLSTVWWTPDQP